MFGLIVEIRRNIAAKKISGFLRFLGKSNQKVAAVFGHTPEACHCCVAHVRAGAPGIPIWLFSTVPPDDVTVSICDAVHVDGNAFALLLRAQKLLWPRWVALSVGVWTGDPGGWPLKLAPLLIPPFRALFLNARHDFLPGTPVRIFYHNWRNGRDRLHSAIYRLGDIASGCWWLISYHIWRSGPCTRAKDLLRSFGLWTVATLLRWSSYPHRRWFPRIHGRDRLLLSPPPGEGSSVAPFTQHGPEWEGEELEKLVLSSKARWILWHEDGVVESAGDMLPLFDDERTFAVARQIHYRGWKKQLAAAAPFRTLQPGEATRVLAPLSRALLVDRRKLAALGIPKCSLPGAAWMLLFWKAGAAGWRSYSIGQSRAVRPQPDCPMDEASFLLRMLGDSDLRRLGPAEPPLSAGNIAFLPARAHSPRAASGRLKVLVVSPFLPFPLSHGGAVRIYNLCRALCSRVDFVLAAIREKDEAVDYARLHEVFREVRVVDLDEAASADASLPRQVRHHRSQSLRALIADVAHTWKPDVLQIEYTHMAAFGDAAPGVPSILVEHDLTFSLYHQLASSRPTPESWREYERWKAFEQRWLRAFDGVWLVSDEDRLTALRETGREPGLTYTIPNGVDTARFLPREESTAAPEILYVGSFRHLPNLIGFEALCRDVMPRVWARYPQARLRVVAGPRHEEFWRQSAALDARIEIHGFVEDLRPLYARASVAAVPLEVSAGTNIKVLEAMACGKAIVSTPIGCAGLGLEGARELLIRDDWPDFAAAIGAILQDRVVRSDLGARARRTAEDRFSWSAIAGAAYDSYLAVSGRTRRARLQRRELAS